MLKLKRSAPEIQSAPPSRLRVKSHIIVFGNEKGGSGKSTSAMHVAVALLRQGYTVGTVDLDARQGTFTRYLRNRVKYSEHFARDLPIPFHKTVENARADSVARRESEEHEFLGWALADLGQKCDFIVIDTPGSDSNLNRLAHGYADTLITPMNDSFIDLDALADIDPETFTVRALSAYTRMVREQFTRRRELDGVSPQWIVMRNRLAHVDAHNKRQIAGILDSIGALQNFTIAPGFGERVIFRELFLKGLTLLDLREDGGQPLTLSRIAARQEVRQLIAAIGPERFKEPKREIPG